jgi:adenosylhomocysteine nucleosidase
MKGSCIFTSAANSAASSIVGDDAMAGGSSEHLHSTRSNRSGSAIAPASYGRPQAAFSPTEWPIIAVTCLAAEAHIAAGPGVAVLQGHIPNLGEALGEAIARGCSGIISFGIAGGLASDLAPGAWVVASGVVAAHKRYPTDRDWARRMLQALGCAIHADIAGVDAPVIEQAGKRSLRDATSSVAVDMESHIAAEAAQAHGLPFAACRVIIDPAHRSLPPAALVNLRPDGSPDVAAVLRSLIRQPRQLPALLRVAADARAAQLALCAGRQRLGAGLAFPGFQLVPAHSDMAGVFERPTVERAPGLCEILLPATPRTNGAEPR